MPGNSFGQIFRMTTFGESHGGAVGVVVDGVTPGLELTEAEIQKELDRRKPGQSAVTTPRQETDTVHILSGIFEGRTTGTSLMMILYNKDAQPSAYDEIRSLFRPGHADYSYLKKYGIRDYRGSGRASGRETAGRVAAGAVARKLLARRGISITACTREAAGVVCSEYHPDVIEQNPMRACDLSAAAEMEQRVLELAEQGNSAGGIVECRVDGVPAGLGEPVFGKLDAELSGAVMSIGAVKGIEFGAGFSAAGMTGREHNDEMQMASTDSAEEATQDGSGTKALRFLTNNAGGIIGGISTGEEIRFRIVVKPTSSISSPQQTVSVDGRNETIRTEGRHDPCICPRIVPVVEAMTAIVLLDQIKRQEAMTA
ncbi:MAG: chorismate synthase [Spirochaetales bacterium]|nr:chorismate synthase [Spirochaetales bacterium]MCF7938731.1 chorismate synthase [Spirochaetales bacterium]